MKEAGSGLLRQLLKGGKQFQQLVPIGFTRNKDMRRGRNWRVTVETARREHQQCAVHLNIRQGRAAFDTKTLYMTCIVEVKGFHQVLARDPAKGCRGRKQIGRVGRPGILAAPFAMAQIETLEFAFDLESDLAAQTRSHIIHAYTSTSRFVLKETTLQLHSPAFNPEKHDTRHPWALRPIST